MEQKLYSKSVINSLLFEIQNYPYLRMIEDQQLLISFLNYENSLLCENLSDMVENIKIEKTNYEKQELVILKLKAANYEQQQLNLHLNAQLNQMYQQNISLNNEIAYISHINTKLDERLAINNYQLLETNRQMVNNFTHTISNNNHEMLLNNKSMRKTITNLKNKQKTTNKKNSAKIMSLKFENNHLISENLKNNKYIGVLENKNKILSAKTNLTEQKELKLKKLETDVKDFETLSNKLKYDNLKLKKDNNNLHKTIIDLQIDLTDSKLNVEYLQEELEDVSNDKEDLKKANLKLIDTIINFVIKTENLKKQVSDRDNDIKWYHEEYVKQKHMTIKLKYENEDLSNEIEWYNDRHVDTQCKVMGLSNTVCKLQESVANEIKLKTAYKSEFTTLNSLFTKKQIELGELKKQMKTLQNDNNRMNIRSEVNESIIKELRGKLSNLTSVNIKTPVNIQTPVIENETSSTTKLTIDVENISDNETLTETLTGTLNETSSNNSDDEVEWAIY